MSQDSKITAAEWEVMDVLWRESPLTSAQVCERLEPVTGWRPATVKTLLGRLVKKGQLDYETEGNRYLYRPGVSRRAAIGEESRSFVERVFRGDGVSTLLHFARTVDLSDEEARRLRELLDRRADDPEPKTEDER